MSHEFFPGADFITLRLNDSELKESHECTNGFAHTDFIRMINIDDRIWEA